MTRTGGDYLSKDLKVSGCVCEAFTAVCNDIEPLLQSSDNTIDIIPLYKYVNHETSEIE